MQNRLMPKRYEAIYELAKCDLPIADILDFAAKINPGLEDDIVHKNRIDIVNVIFAFYNSWLFRLSSIHVADEETNTHIRLKGYFYNDIINSQHFIGHFRNTIYKEVMEALADYKPTNIVQLLGPIYGCIRSVFTGATNFASVLSKINNGVDAARRVFGGVDTPHLQAAYEKLVKPLFLQYIKAQSLIEHVMKREREEALACFDELEVDFFSITISSSHPETNQKGYTLFHLICDYGRGELLNVVLDKISEDIDRFKKLKNRPKGWDPKKLNEKMWWAIEQNNIERVVLCLKLGADIHACSGASRKTVLEMAAEKGRTEMVKFLISQKASVKKPEGGHFSVLHRAFKADPVDPQMIELLLDADADVNEIDLNRQTPLFPAIKAAIKSDDHSLVIKLVLYGANPHHLDSKGISPIIFARQLTYNSIADAISDAHLDLTRRLEYQERLNAGLQLQIQELKKMFEQQTKDSQVKKQHLKKKIKQLKHDETSLPAISSLFKHSEYETQPPLSRQRTASVLVIESVAELMQQYASELSFEQEGAKLIIESFKAKEQEGAQSGFFKAKVSVLKKLKGAISNEALPCQLISSEINQDNNKLTLYFNSEKEAETVLNWFKEMNVHSLLKQAKSF